MHPVHLHRGSFELCYAEGRILFWSSILANARIDFDMPGIASGLGAVFPEITNNQSGNTEYRNTYGINLALVVTVTPAFDVNEFVPSSCKISWSIRTCIEIVALQSWDNEQYTCCPSVVPSPTRPLIQSRQVKARNVECTTGKLDKACFLPYMKMCPKSLSPESIIQEWLPEDTCQTGVLSDPTSSVFSWFLGQM